MEGLLFTAEDMESDQSMLGWILSYGPRVSTSMNPAISVKKVLTRFFLAERAESMSFSAESISIVKIGGEPPS